MLHSFQQLKNKFYVGSTNGIQRRLTEHNYGQTISTKYGIPWKLIFTKEFNTKSESTQLEIKIKKRGIVRYLNDLKQLG